MKSRKEPVRAPAKKRPQAKSTLEASELIDRRIRELGDWRGKTLARMRALILKAEPGITEEWKWLGTPVWSHRGIVCTAESYAKVVKLTFARGAELPDPARLFNSSLEGNTRRAIDLHEGERIDPVAFRALVQAAVARNASKASRSKRSPRAADAPRATATDPESRASSVRRPDKTSRKAGAKPKPSSGPARRKVVLLAGGNPQIAKADGDEPVQAYIAALPGWKRDLGQRLDALLERSVPNVRKAVKWNSPLYGIEGRGWFLGIHAFTRYLKLAFFRGAALRPLPPGASKDPQTRYLDLHEDDALDEAQLTRWFQQAAALPGWEPGRSP